MSDQTEPVDVRVANFTDLVFRTEESEPEHFVFTTITLQAPSALSVQGQGPQMILDLDPLRKDASVYSPDGPWVLCHSAAQASAPANQVAGVPVPDGAFVQQGQPVSLTGTGAAWAASPAAIRLVVMINRRDR